LLGCIVLILVVIGLLWFLNGHGGSNAALSSKPGNSTPTSNELLLEPATLSTTNIPITPNVDISTDTPVAILSETETPLPSLTPTAFGNTPILIHTQVPCGSPNSWVVYIVRPGDSLYRLSQVYGVTIAALQQANCLGTTTTLHTGQLLYVPRTVVIVPSATLPIIVMPTFTPSDTPVIIPPSDTPTEPPIDTATQVSIATNVPTSP
jgi:LysM repeat protein